MEPKFDQFRLMTISFVTMTNKIRDIKNVHDLAFLQAKKESGILAKRIPYSSEENMNMMQIAEPW